MTDNVLGSFSGPPRSLRDFGPVVDEDLALPVRHERMARRVAELVTAELAPAMIPATLQPAPLQGLWEWCETSAPGRQWRWVLSPFPIGPHIIESAMTVDAARRTIAVQLACDGGLPIWSGTLREV